MWNILLKALLGASKKILISKTKRLIGSNVLKDIVRVNAMNSSLGIKKYTRQLKVLKNIYKNDNKADKIVYEATRKNNYLRRVYNIYKLEQEKNIKEALKEYKKLETRIEQDMIYKFKNGVGLSKQEFTSFRDNFLKQNIPTKKFLKEILNKEMKIIFESSWILFGVFIPYGRKKDRGILGLQLYNTTSKRNPSLFYQWVRVPMWVWNCLEDEATGEQFWKKWYRDNKDNPFYLTKDSIYYYNNKDNKKE